MIECYVFDIDGTIADLTHRLHYLKGFDQNLSGEANTFKPDWDAFFDACKDDKPIEHVIQIVIDLHAQGRHIVYVSGRSDRIREMTSDWLFKHGLPNGALYMRTHGDHRPDNLVKLDLLKELTADGYKPRMAFDDRNQVVQMWRTAGIPCAQVADGDF